MTNHTDHAGLSSEFTHGTLLPPPHPGSSRAKSPVFDPAPDHASTTTFVLQPVYDISSDTPVVTYYEVLARGPFVASMLEHSHVELLELACRFAARAIRELDAPLLVNVEPRSLNEAPSHVVEAISAARCHVEVTERGALTALALDALRDLHDNGAEVWLDDFGTGESTPALRRGLLTAGFVKGVKLYVEGLIEAPAGLTLIVEGVETPEHLAAARRHGAALVQGFLLGLPAPLEEYAA